MGKEFLLWRKLGAIIPGDVGNLFMETHDD